MPISGLIVTFEGNAAEYGATVERVAAHEAFTTGIPTERWLPVAMEARNDHDSRDLHDWLAGLPGVAFVDVVSVDFGSTEETVI